MDLMPLLYWFLIISRAYKATCFMFLGKLKESIYNTSHHYFTRLLKLKFSSSMSLVRVLRTGVRVRRRENVTNYDSELGSSQISLPVCSSTIENKLPRTFYKIVHIDTFT